MLSTAELADFFYIKNNILRTVEGEKDINLTRHIREIHESLVEKLRAEAQAERADSRIRETAVERLAGYYFGRGVRYCFSDHVKKQVEAIALGNKKCLRWAWERVAERVYRYKGNPLER